LRSFLEAKDTKESTQISGASGYIFKRENSQLHLQTVPPREKILNFMHSRGEDLQERKFSTSCAAVVKISKSGILCQ
jgi:hypothetical protein